MINFVEELRWRGMLHDIMPETENLLTKGEVVRGYIGFDPTADSLTVGNLAQIMVLLHFQRAGHQPYALVGGATGMVGDPSGKSEERKLLSLDSLQHNVDSIHRQLAKFLDFDAPKNAAKMVNNYDWFQGIEFLSFIRDVGKHITVNYMLSKDSVQNRLQNGLSFTEFTYQLIQGYDFLHLYRAENVLLQMGGSDQWGNITTGTELVRRVGDGKAYAITTKLVTKADGEKFGKSEKGAVWLDEKRTSVYEFYQFWLNVTDEDVKKFIRIFTLLDRETVETLEAQHNEAPHLRILQKTLAKDITSRVHSPESCAAVIDISELLFSGKLNNETLRSLDENILRAIGADGLTFNLEKNILTKENGVKITELMAELTQISPSKSEARKAIQNNAVSVNKEKVKTHELMITEADLLHGKFLMIENGKKNKYMIEFS
ncbi:MAG: tyrosyl-tRNA synthetase [Bacteroidota bacterium]|jgi:tyrosyl-tRNA synthetase